MPRKPAASFSEKQLTKGQLRKLNALRKSVGERIGNRAFANWLTTQQGAARAAPDKTAEAVARTLESLIKQRKLRIPRGGYLVRRGRGRVIVTRTRTD